MRFVGDVHLGRTFKTGVPLNRRGEIEEKFWEAFIKVMQNPIQQKVVQLGDLFDSPVVDNDVLWRAYDVIRYGANKNPDTSFYFIAGNHDLSKDEADVPAIRILRELLRDCENVFFVVDVPLLVEDFTLIPWSYTVPLGDFIKGINTPNIAGHFEEPIDPALLNSGLIAYSGHIHKMHTNGNVRFIGSILPIAFGEENDAAIMETVYLDELLSHQDRYHDKRVRVLLKEGEDLPADIDCLQLIGKRLDNPSEEKETLDVSLEDFDFKELFMKELGPSGKAEELWEMYNNA